MPGAQPLLFVRLAPGALVVRQARMRLQYKMFDGRPQMQLYGWLWGVKRFGAQDSAAAPAMYGVVPS